jgi:hypothetical protein
MLAGLVSGIIQWITGPLLTYLGKLSDAEVAKFKAATGAERDVIIAQLQANAGAYHDRTALLGGMRATQYLIVAALAPALFHQGLVILDSCPFLPLPWFPPHVIGSWRVPALPAPYADREWAMIAALLGIQTGLVAAGSFLRWLHVR